MIRLAVLPAMTWRLRWNVGSPAPGEWMVWCGDWLKCGGCYHVAALLAAEGLTITLVDDADREYEPDCWEWRIEP
jgi:hypothetical protein